MSTGKKHIVLRGGGGGNKYEARRYSDSHKYLPEGIIYRILVKIPPLYLPYFRLVSKGLKGMIDEEDFVAENFTETSKTGFLVQGINDPRIDLIKLVHVEDNDTLDCSVMDIELKRARRVRFSCRGLLIASNIYGLLEVINPANMFCVTLPPCPSDCFHVDITCKVALWFDCSSNEYKVVHISDKMIGFEVFYLTLSNHVWKQGKLQWEADWDEDLWQLRFNGIGNAVPGNEKYLHWPVGSNKYIMSMDVREETFRKTYFPSIGKKLEKNELALMHLDGKLAFSYLISDTLIDIWTLEDYENQIWSKKHTIVATDELLVPNFHTLIPYRCASNGEVIAFVCEDAPFMYIYDMKRRVMQLVNLNVYGIHCFLPHQSSLFRLAL